MRTLSTQTIIHPEGERESLNQNSWRSLVVEDIPPKNVKPTLASLEKSEDDQSLKIFIKSHDL